MRILKYLFLLLLLSLVALSIFVATQKGEFTIERSRVINSPKSTIYSYINDSKNWKYWNSWAVEDTLMYFKYFSNDTKKGVALSWDGKENDGNIETLKNVVNHSIFQRMNYNGNSSELTLRLKDTIKGTKVSWKAKIQLGFINKIMTTFQGSSQSDFLLMLEKSLANLDQRLDYEVNAYSVKLNGVSIMPECFYLEQTFTSEFSKVRKNSDIVFNKIIRFCKQNKISISGKPFLIYHNYDVERKLTRISICIPIQKEIFITEGSEIMAKKLRSQPVVKVTLTGDYLHSQKALEKANAFINEKKYFKNTIYSHFEVFVKDKSNTNNISQWITEVQIPIHPKRISKSTNPTPETSNDSIVGSTKIENEMGTEQNVSN